MKKPIVYLVAIKIVVLIFLFSDSGCKREKRDKDAFSVAFMTDIHIQPELNAAKGLEKALDTINILKPDFIITGGDLIMDALATPYARVDSLYNLYSKTVRKANMPVYNTIGNHRDLWYLQGQREPTPWTPVMVIRS